jgi:ABC-type bacteriocin/lantibiotic exporter with double-glycine peptidase domain
MFLFSGTSRATSVWDAKTLPTSACAGRTEVRADSFIQRLPHEYKSEVRERGAGLSVGQKQ